MENKERLAKVIPGRKDYSFTDLSDFVKANDIKFMLHNTKTRATEEFIPNNPELVTLYTCGPTVYKDAHIGNLRTYISEDILKKALIMYGYKVKHIMNVTDVGHLTDDADEGDDKMEKSAKELNMDAWNVAAFYFKKFREDFEALNNMDPTLWSTATGHIEEQLEIISVLEKKGYTYRTSDGIYFDTAKFPKYAEFGQLDVEHLQAGHRVEMTDEKKNITDFALWKFSEPEDKRQMEWDSPWGVGFPGWHLECSAMAIKYLGENLDIHAGGTDHIKVHHTNEIAQSESFLGHPWCKYWFHAEFLVLDNNKKMSKSSGNFLTVTSLREHGFDPLVYRYYCLNANYSKQLVFHWEGMESAKVSLSRLCKRALEIKTAAGDRKGTPDENYMKDFFTPIYDDLNVSKALGIFWNLMKDDKISDENKWATMLLFDEILTLNIKDVKAEEKELPQEVKDLISQRDEARKNKDYALSDEIRNKLQYMGYTVKDSKEGTKVE